jgi:hypothetical protein
MLWPGIDSIPGPMEWLWMQGDYDPFTRTRHVWPVAELMNGEIIHDVEHDRSGRFGESLCWCQPKRQVLLSGQVQIVHSTESGGSDASVPPSARN